VADRVKKAGAALSEVLGFEFRSHDLRRTAATRMAAAGVPRDHVSRVLNHVEGGPTATRVYDRYSYDAEKRAALDTWQRELRRILTEQQKAGADVVSIATRGRR
jgi:integrase